MAPGLQAVARVLYAHGCFHLFPAIKETWKGLNVVGIRNMASQGCNLLPFSRCQNCHADSERHERVCVECAFSYVVC